MKSTPSLLALLGLVAVAGYQNRNKITEMIDHAQQSQRGGSASGQPNLLSGIAGLFGSGGRGGSLSSGLSDLVNQFTSAGHGIAAQSWVAVGQNEPLKEHDLVQAIGDETLDELVTKTGLSRADLIRRLTAAVPEIVNQLTPEGRLPTETEAQKLL